MGNVTDVSAAGSDGPAVLTATSAGGLLGGKLLSDDPLVTYLSETEQPAYVLRNKKRGLVVERDGIEERIEPDEDYQALCVVTDVRLLVVVGKEPRDESMSIRLAEIVSVGVDEGVLGGEIAVVDGAEERYAFPCRGDLATVARYVDEGTQAWARAYTLLDRAETALEDAATSTATGDFDAAIDAVDDASEVVTDAKARLADLGEGALAAFEGEADEIASRIERRRHTVHEAHGKAAQEDAREHWERREYDAAYDSYAEAEAAFERARTLRDDASVTERLERVRKEWRNLEVAPVAYAEAMADEARQTDRPDTAAQCWEVALERYRDVYVLDWGRDERRFDVEREGVRERILEILDAVVERRIAAAERAREDAADLREEGATVTASDRLENALAGIDRAIALVEELRSDGHEELRAERDALADELASIEAPAASM